MNDAEHIEDITLVSLRYVLGIGDEIILLRLSFIHFMQH